MKSKQKYKVGDFLDSSDTWNYGINPERYIMKILKIEKDLQINDDCYIIRFWNIIKREEPFILRYPIEHIDNKCKLIKITKEDAFAELI